MNGLRGLLLTGAVVLSGCGDRPPLSGQQRADAETQAACRQRAEAIYNQQNRGQIYSPASQVNSPFSASYQPDQTDRGLAQLYSHDKIISDCVRNNGVGAERSPPPQGQTPSGQAASARAASGQPSLRQPPTDQLPPVQR